MDHIEPEVEARPGMSKKSVVLRNQPKMPLAMARAALTLSARPRELPCRDKEKQAISGFLNEAVAG
eukprot:scaffold15498_cov19-Prasinocladus_malaysianus.AAC.1